MIVYKRKLVLYLFALLLLSMLVQGVLFAAPRKLPRFVPGGDTYATGPLHGKSMYTPFLLYYNFPSHSARGNDRFVINWHNTFYVTNDFIITRWTPESDDYFTVDEGIDYESLTVELGISFTPIRNLEVGVDMRLVTYYGGFLDAVIEGFHQIGFPNAGREFFRQNKVEITIPTSNGLTVNLREPAVSMGDIDLWVKYTFLDRKRIALATVGAFKIPTGQFSMVSGSGYPDMGVSLLADFTPTWIVSLYLQAGFVLPLDLLVPATGTTPNPMFNGIFALELHPLPFFSLVGQLNIRTSPWTGNWIFTNNLTITGDLIGSVQTNILVGVKFTWRTLTWQIYVEEDAFTNAGTDITFNIMFNQQIRIRRR
jgi:hypothetical protein